jgi:hypothetical protein
MRVVRAIADGNTVVVAEMNVDPLYDDLGDDLEIDRDTVNVDVEVTVTDDVIEVLDFTDESEMVAFCRGGKLDFVEYDYDYESQRIKLSDLELLASDGKTIAVATIAIAVLTIRRKAPRS